MVRIPEDSRMISIDGYIIDLTCCLFDVHGIFGIGFMIQVRIKDMESTTLSTNGQAPIVNVNWIE